MDAAPLRVVKTAMLRGGSSIFAEPAFKYHFWELHLECGHIVERRIKWLRIPNPPRGWQAQHKGVSLERLPPEPSKARCEICRGEA